MKTMPPQCDRDRTSKTFTRTDAVLSAAPVKLARQVSRTLAPRLRFTSATEKRQWNIKTKPCYIEKTSRIERIRKPASND